MSTETNVDAKAILDTQVTGVTSQGGDLHGRLVRVTRFMAVFDLFTPELVVRLSEVLSDFKILLNGRTVYSGRAVISKILPTGISQLCEVELDDSWIDVTDLSAPATGSHHSRFSEFFQQWQRIYRVRPEFKVVVADMQTFLTDLRLWLEQLELEIRSKPEGDRTAREREVAEKLAPSTAKVLTELFERFEHSLSDLEPELQAVHQVFARRQLHPMLLSSPFLYRTFAKPLGYAGDYEMVNMIMRDPFEGGSLYSKIVNHWFWQQAPAEAHRNRIKYLTDQITAQALRARQQGRKARVANLGCGPAHEVQRFIQQSPYTEHVDFFLLDFNPETLEYVKKVINSLKRSYEKPFGMHLIKKSVNQVLKESGKRVERFASEHYDFVYCAGLFDYLADPICQKLTDVLYDWVAPGGTLVTTNVDTSNPRIITMNYIMEWHLIYRSGAELFALKPRSADPENCAVTSDVTGVNVYFEATRPNRA